MHADRGWLRSCGLGLACLIGLLAGTVRAGEEISPAEHAVFVREHLGGIEVATDLRYEFHHEESAQAELSDTVTVFVRPEPARGRVVRAEFLHGEHSLNLPEIEHAAANPVVLYFLEHDVRSMRQRLGGMESYFRKRIRVALADRAQLEAVEFEYGGVVRKGQRIEIAPYLGDPNRERFKGLDSKRYHFTISEEVPGGVYEIGTTTDGDEARNVPAVREWLRLSARGG